MITTTWIKYVDRTFLSIKDSLLNRLRITVPEMTDYSPSNLFMIIVDMFSGVAELINYYIDTTARELFVSTARRFSSLLKLAEYAGYYGKAMVPAQATVKFYFDGDIVAVDNFIIPAGTILNSSGSIPWVLNDNVYFRKDTYAAYGFVTQYVQVTGYDIGTSDGTANQLFILPDDYAQGSLDVQVGGVYWNRVDTLGFSSPTDTDFMVALKPDGALYLVFGDGVNGYIPDDSLTIVGNYKSTQGATINVGMGQIISIISSLSLPAGSGTLKVTNPSKSFGAKNVEGMEDLRRAIPLSIRTLDRAVTRQDYIDVALMAPGVRAAVLAFDCGLGVTLYIVPNGGGVANASFLDEVKEFVEAKAIATIPIQTKPSGETRIRLKVRVTGKYRITANLIRTKVLQRLESLYDPYKTSINQSIRVSDIIAAIDNLPEVDFLTMDYIYAVPYLRPSNLALDLEYRATIKSTSINSFTWRLVYSSSASTFTLFKNGVQVQADMTVGVYSNIAGILDFELMSIPPDIVNADYWEFTTYPYNRDIEITDRSIPVIYPEDVVLEIKEQYV